MLTGVRRSECRPPGVRRNAQYARLRLLWESARNGGDFPSTYCTFFILRYDHPSRTVGIARFLSSSVPGSTERPDAEPFV